MTAKQFLTLQETLQAELLRRNACGSLAAYAEQGESSDSSSSGTLPDTPGEEAKNIVPGTAILAKDGRKVIEPLLAIQDYGDLVVPEPGKVIPDSFEESLITYVNELSKESMTGSTTSCRGACTGLCMSGCSSSCSGCKSGCTGCGGCSASCGTGCAGGSRA